MPANALRKATSCLAVGCQLSAYNNHGADADGLAEDLHLLLVLEVRVIVEALDLLKDVPPDLIARARHVLGELVGPALEGLLVLAVPWRRLTGVHASEVRLGLNEVFVL